MSIIQDLDLRHYLHAVLFGVIKLFVIKLFIDILLTACAKFKEHLGVYFYDHCQYGFSKNSIQVSAKSQTLFAVMAAEF